MVYSRLKKHLIYTPLAYLEEADSRYGLYPISNLDLQYILEGIDKVYVNELWVVNEALYHITLAYQDPMPEDGVYSKCIDVIKHTFPDMLHVRCCIAIIIVILSHQQYLPDRICCFMARLKGEAKVKGDLEETISIIERNLPFNWAPLSNFAPTPEEPRNLITDDFENSWYYCTNGYDYHEIERIINRYNNYHDRRTIVNMIYSEFKRGNIDYTCSVFKNISSFLHSDSYRKCEDADFENWITTINEAIKKGDTVIPVYKPTWMDKLKRFLNPKFEIGYDTVVFPSTSLFVDVSDEVKDLKTRLATYSAKLDMVMQENEILKEMVNRSKTRELQVFHQFRKEFENKQATPLMQALSIDKIADYALTSYDVDYVEHILKLIYSMTGSVVAEEKDLAIKRIEGWINALRIKAHNVKIQTYNQYGGNFFDKIENQNKRKED